MKAATKLLLTAIAASFTASCTTTQKQTASELTSDYVVIQSGRDSLVYPDKDGWQPSANLDKAIVSGDADDAVVAARAELQKKPGDPARLLALSTALAKDRNYQLAAYYAHQVLKAEQNNATAWNIVGLAAMLRTKASPRDLEEATQAFQNAFTNGRNIAAGLNLAHLQLETGRAAEAGQTFAAVAEQCGRCTDSLIGLGIAQSRSGKANEAIATFSEVIKRDPKNGTAFFHRAVVHSNTPGKRTAAEDDLHEVLQGGVRADRELKEKSQSLMSKVRSEREENQPVDAPALDEKPEVLPAAADKEDNAEEMSE